MLRTLPWLVLLCCAACESEGAGNDAAGALPDARREMHEGGEDDAEADQDDADVDSGNLVDAARLPVELDASAPEPADAAAADAAQADAAACMAHIFRVHEVRPDVLVVLDRSLSMALSGRWQPTTAALKEFVSSWHDRLQLGLQLFPSTPVGSTVGCDVGALDVACDYQSAAAISSAIDATAPAGQTPTGAVLEKALQVLGSRAFTGSRPAFVLLLTDGEPGCLPALAGMPDATEVERTKAAVRVLAAAGIPTYVVGYQIDLPLRPLMNELAVLGGTASYREGENQLSGVLYALGTELVSCTLELALAAENVGVLSAALDGSPLALDAPNGWRFEDRRVVLQGDSCTRFKNDEQHGLEVANACSP